MKFSGKHIFIPILLIQIFAASCNKNLDFVLPSNQLKINDEELAIFGLVRDIHAINDSSCLFIANRTILAKFNYVTGKIEKTLHIDSLFNYQTAMQQFAIKKHPNRNFFDDTTYTQPKILIVSSVNTPKGYLCFLKVLSPYKTQEENTNITTYTYEFFALLFDYNLNLKQQTLVKNPVFVNEIAPNIEHNIGYCNNAIYASTISHPQSQNNKPKALLNRIILNDTLINYQQLSTKINYSQLPKTSDNLYIPTISFSTNTMAYENCIYHLISETQLSCNTLAKNEKIIAHYCKPNTTQCYYISNNIKSYQKTLCTPNNQCYQFKNPNEIKTIKFTNNQILALRNLNYQNFIEVYELP